MLAGVVKEGNRDPKEGLRQSEFDQPGDGRTEHPTNAFEDDSEQAYRTTVVARFHEAMEVSH
jgi:hypothetical protein